MYCIYLNNCREIYSFFKLKFVENYIVVEQFYFYVVNAATTIKGRQLLKGGNYSRKYGIF